MSTRKSKIVAILLRHTLITVALVAVFNSFASAQTVTISRPTADQPFCGMGTFDIPVQGTVAGGSPNTVIEWSVTIGTETYTTCTQSGAPGVISVTKVPSSFGITKVTAVAVTSSQQFSGTGSYYGPGALRVTILQAGENFEGYVVSNCDPNEQDMVVGERTDALQPGTYLIKGYCTDRHAGTPRSGVSFGAPRTSESTSHWAYWERQAIIYSNQRGFSPSDVLNAIWYVSDRSGRYNQILSAIGYPSNGPTKNFGVDVTPPTTPIVTDDGDSTLNGTQLHAMWTSQEFESGIVEYQYAIGTARGATDVVNWTSNGGIPEVTHKGLNLEARRYYFAVKAQNGAGLWSAPGYSDGILVIIKDFSAQTVYNFPNPFSPEVDGFTRITFSLTASAEVNIKIFDTSGEMIWEERRVANRGKNFVNWAGKNKNGKTVANGVYFCRVDAQGKSVIKKIAVLNDYKP